MKRHAYLVMAHGGFEQLAALLALIDDSRNDIFLHIDKKAGKVDEASLFAAVSLSRLNLIPRVSVNWGGYSQIACVFALLQAALNAGDYAYLHLISGADLPLRTQDAMHAFFDSHDGREFIEFSGMAIDANTKCRLSLYHFFQEWPRKGSIYRRMEDASLRFQMRKGVDRTLGEQSVFQKGATWFSITGALARFAVENERAIRERYRFTNCCDEVFLQTLIYNSEFRKQLYNPPSGIAAFANLRYTLWDDGTNSPRVLRACDLDSMMNSGCLFARKFDPAVDPDVMANIAAILKENATQGRN